MKVNKPYANGVCAVCANLIADGKQHCKLLKRACESVKVCDYFEGVARTGEGGK